jgi:hypothetical protein
VVIGEAVRSRRDRAANKDHAGKGGKCGPCAGTSSLVASLGPHFKATMTARGLTAKPDFAVVKLLHSQLFFVASGGFLGGYDDSTLISILKVA